MPRSPVLLLLPALLACKGDKGDTGDSYDCEVAIIGGGAGGLHTAFRLAPDLGDGVCLFEKESELGGRIHDITLDDSDPDAVYVGAGARRVMEGQEVLFNLADELGMTLEKPDLKGDFISARGGFAFSKEDLVSLYPDVTPSDDGDTETALYDELRFGPERANAASYPDFETYIRTVVGDEGYEYLRDMSRFRADFEYPLDAAGYLDYLDEEWDVCCTPSYPVGGMHQFIKGMAASAEANGARIYTSDPVSSINRDADGGYDIAAANETVRAEKVVIAVPPSGFDYIDGDVADDIKAQTPYQDIVGVKVVTITQWWSDPWWTAITDPSDPESTGIWRGWTTENCLNFIEIPIEPYAAASNVTRSVYNDNAECSDFWEDLYDTGGTAAVEAEIQSDLTYLFSDNGVSSPDTLTIPDPLGTKVQIWPAAWYWLGAGASETNAELYDWAVEPLAGEEVGLVGEAYNVQRSGWSDGAYKSSIHLLNERYGMSLSGI